MPETDDTKTSAAPPAPSSDVTPQPATPKPATPPLPPEIGGPKGPEPTRFGDWEQKGRATDF